MQVDEFEVHGSEVHAAYIVTSFYIVYSTRYEHVYDTHARMHRRYECERHGTYFWRDRQRRSIRETGVGIQSKTVDSSKGF